MLDSLVCLYLCIEGFLVWIKVGCYVRSMFFFFKVLIRWNWEVFWNLEGCWSLIQNKLLIMTVQNSKVFWEGILLFQYTHVPVVLLILGFYHVSWFLTLHNIKFLLFPLGGEWSCAHHKVVVIDFWYMEFCFFNLVFYWSSFVCVTRNS